MDLGALIDLERPQVMGILNITPDSFSDGGRFLARESALKWAERMVEEGAAIIDVGGESTRPGAVPVSTEEELRRVIPVIRAIRRRLAIPISIDTQKPQVMRQAVEAGASLINDVSALRAPGALEVAASLKVPVCLMHMQGEPRTMQNNPDYGNVVEEVKAFLAQRIEACLAAGIPKERLVIDPGFGFGKTLEHNKALLRGLDRLLGLGVPLLVGFSRKSMIGQVIHKPVEERLYGSLALAALAVWKGAHIVRVHDVGPTVDVIRMVHAVNNA